MVWAGSRATIVLPDRDKDLGDVREDQLIVPVKRQTPRGIEIDYELVEPNSPRARNQLTPPK